jgi:hypothetical protein
MEKIISDPLEEIKRSMNSQFAYIVFEKLTTPNDENTFQEIIDLVTRFGIRILESSSYPDRDSRKSFLVIKMGPKVTKPMIQELIEAGFSEHITCFFYAGSLKS